MERIEGEEHMKRKRENQTKKIEGKIKKRLRRETKQNGSKYKWHKRRKRRRREAMKVNKLKRKEK